MIAFRRGVQEGLAKEGSFGAGPRRSKVEMRQDRNIAAGKNNMSKGIETGQQ